MNRPTAKAKVIRKAGILAVGLDCTDGHTRITRGDNFLLFGGSEATHEILQAQVVKFNEELERLGKTLETATETEIDSIAAKLKVFDDTADDAE
jgi:hypothetical protein